MNNDILRQIAATTVGTEALVEMDGLAPVTQLCKANPHRFAVEFIQNDAAGVVVTTVPDANSLMGHNLDPGEAKYFSVRDYGNYAQMAWYARNTGSISHVTVVEIVFPNGG